MIRGCSGPGRAGATISGLRGAGRGGGGRTTDGAAGAPPPCDAAGALGGGGGGGIGGGGTRSTSIGGSAVTRGGSGRPTPRSTKAPRCRRTPPPPAPQRHCFIRVGRNRLSRTGSRTLTLQKSRGSEIGRAHV